MKQFHSMEVRTRRIPITKKAVLITCDGNQLDVVVTDISAGGLRLKAYETFYNGENILIGEEVIIRVDRRTDLRAEIVWAEGCEAGGVFLESGNPDQ